MRNQQRKRTCVPHERLEDETPFSANEGRVWNGPPFLLPKNLKADFILLLFQSNKQKKPTHSPHHAPTHPPQATQGPGLDMSHEP